ncbi:MAG TPA: LysR family transcriptional regulator, partial [Sedimentisphaerales bacterium]
MEMHEVRYFLALCEEGSFTRAAKRCGVAQPSLTKAIKRLESKLGGDLFYRGHAETRLTKLGK